MWYETPLNSSHNVSEVKYTTTNLVYKPSRKIIQYNLGHRNMPRERVCQDYTYFRTFKYEHFQ